MQKKLQLILILCCIIPISIIYYQPQYNTQNTDELKLDSQQINSEKKNSILQYRAPILDETNLIANWRFNEGSGSSASDSSGNGYTGTITGAEWVDGYQSLALDLERSNGDYIDCGDHNDFSFNNDTPFSIALWFKPESNDVNQALFSKYLLPSDKEYLLQCESQTLKFYLSNPDSANYLAIQKTSLLQNTDEWYFIVATYNGSKTNAGMHLYSNCTQLSTSNANAGTYSGMGNTNSDFVIGMWSNKIINPIDGVIDEVRIYDKELNQTEVNELYNYTIASFSEVNTGVCSVNITSNFEGSLNGEQMNYSLYLDDVLHSTYNTSSNAQGNSTYALGPLLRNTEYQLTVTTAHYIHEYYFTIEFETVGNKGIEPTLKILIGDFVLLGIFSLAFISGIWFVYKIFKAAIT